MYHEADGGNHYQHDHRDGVEQHTYIKIELAQRQPCEIEGHDGIESPVGSTVGTEIGECSDIRQHSDNTQCSSADEASHLVRHLHSTKSKYEE